MWLVAATTPTDAQAPFPESAFAYDRNPEVAQGRWVHVAEEIRQRLVQALAENNRDDILAGLVPSKAVAGETWFDLRGIELRKGEISATANLARICWDHARFVDADLTAADFNGALLRGAKFVSVTLRSAVFASAHLEDCDFLACDLTHANLRLCHLSEKSAFRSCKLEGARFDNCTASPGFQISFSSAAGVRFSGASLPGAAFVAVSLLDAHFDRAALAQATFSDCTLDGADLTDADLCSANLRGVVLSRPLRLVRTKLSGAALGDLDLSFVDFQHVEWPDHRCIVGEEEAAEKVLAAKGREREACTLYLQAEDIYRALSERYARIGHSSERLQFKYRAVDARRKLLSLQLTASNLLEYVWLSISRGVDGYGTSPGRLIRSFLLLVSAFTLVYAVRFWACSGDQTSWQRDEPSLAPGSCPSVPSNAQQADTVWARARARAKGRYGVVRRAGTVFTAGLQLSCEASLLSADKVTGIASMIALLRPGGERLVPRGPTRVLVGAQALLGAALLLLAVRLLVELTTN
jgi:uncharacterized protein YjbI with pentapeptide repeats